MKKVWFLALIASMIVLSACEFHTKQPTDETYYKRTQSVEWPSKQL